MALPSAYKEVEYIQSTATNPGTTSSSGQYINTGVTVSKDIKLEIDLQFTVTTTQQRLFGGGYDSSETSGITFDAYINGSTQWARATKNGAGNWQSTSVSANTNRNKFVLDNSKYIIYDSNGTIVYNASNDYTISNTDTWEITLLARNYKSGNKICQHSSAKLYSCKIYDNGTLVRDFVPVLRKSDNKPGLYDLVNDVFYTNQGTGEFTYKEYAESGKIQKIYIGVNQSRPAEPIPTSGLLGYRPLQNNLNDESGNGKNASWYSGTGSFETANGYTGARCNVASTSWNSNYSAQHIVTPINYVGVNLSYLGWINFFAKNGGQRPGFMNISGSGNIKYIYSGLRPAKSYGFTAGNGISNNGWIDYNTLNTNTWYLIAVVYDDTEGKTRLYINGSKVAEATDYVGVQDTSNFVWRIGCGQFDTKYGGTNGLVRHCAIYNRALTDAEVLQFYNNTK